MMKNRLAVVYLVFVITIGFSMSGYCDENEGISQLGFSNKNEMEFIGAASGGDIETVRKLLTTGIDINGKFGVMGQTALGMASNKGKVKMVKFLIKSGADLNQIGSVGMAPLMHAVNNGHVEIVKVLIANGADANAKGLMGATVIQFAEKYPEIIQILKDAGAK